MPQLPVVADLGVQEEDGVWGTSARLDIKDLKVGTLMISCLGLQVAMVWSSEKLVNCSNCRRRLTNGEDGFETLKRLLKRMTPPRLAKFDPLLSVVRLLGGLCDLDRDSMHRPCHHQHHHLWCPH